LFLVAQSAVGVDPLLEHALAVAHHHESCGRRTRGDSPWRCRPLSPGTSTSLPPMPCARPRATLLADSPTAASRHQRGRRSAVTDGVSSIAVERSEVGRLCEHGPTGITAPAEWCHSARGTSRAAAEKARSAPGDGAGRRPIAMIHEGAPAPWFLVPHPPSYVKGLKGRHEPFYQAALGAIGYEDQPRLTRSRLRHGARRTERTSVWLALWTGCRLRAAAPLRPLRVSTTGGRWYAFPRGRRSACPGDGTTGEPGPAPRLTGPHYYGRLR
jgi:hypothetical protein